MTIQTHYVHNRYSRYSCWCNSRFVLHLLLLLFAANIVVAQTVSVQLPRPHDGQRNAVKRYEIDAKRIGSDFNSDDALPRSREFLRIDSTYYVGWLYEGAYKYNHAADYIGFKNATEPLERALRVIERDYKKQLATRTSELFEFYPLFNFQRDYAIIVTYLNQCYLNSEQPEKSFALARRYLKWNFQRDMFDAYNYMMWVTHRNRYYTSKQYSFLKDNIAANEQLANAYLDSALRRIDRNKKINEQIFPPGYEIDDKLGVYHYKTILFGYDLKIDSTEKYYKLMDNAGRLPNNNYGNFLSISANFRGAEKYYMLAAGTDAGDKRLQEWAYFLSMIKIYKGVPKAGELLMKDMVMAAGSTPGYGWYNIALARCLLYDGQVSESERYIEKAAGFKETHIGTTLGQTQYDFSIQLLKMLQKNDRYEMKRFEHSNWWYNPSILFSLASLKSERYMQEVLMADLLAQNPERDNVIYNILSTENTANWDEVWQVIHSFSNNYFIKVFSKKAQSDPRPNVRKYFNLFTAMLYIQNDDLKEAKKLLDEISRRAEIDPQYEVLYSARLAQAYATLYEKLDDPDLQRTYLVKAFGLYPQLIPFTGLKMPMQISIVGNADKAVVERLKDCNINWITDNSQGAPKVILSFSNKGKMRIASYSVMFNGKTIVPQQSFSYTVSEQAGVSLAYRIFGIGGKVILDNK